MNSDPYRLVLLNPDLQIWEAVNLRTGFRWGVDGCAMQAATHPRGRRHRVVEAVKTVGGQEVPCTVEDLDRCDVDPLGWVWPHHRHTHAAGPVRLEVLVPS